MRANTRWAFVVATLTAGCGGGGGSSVRETTPRREAAAPDEHWETVEDQRWAYADRCGVGPFELVLPERREEWGRRVVMVIHTDQAVHVGTLVEGYPEGRGSSLRWSTGFAMDRPKEEGDHSRCRIGQDGDPGVVVPVGPARPGKPGGGGAAPAPVRPDQPYWTPVDAGELPALQPETVLPPARHQQDGALSWLPHGNPWYYADEYATNHIANDHGMVEIRVRLWFEAPTDMKGVVIQLIDQRLVPDLPIAEYLPRYERRVRDSNARREANRPPPPACKNCESIAWNELVLRCQQDRTRAECKPLHERSGAMPPPPRAEQRPPSPGDGVMWVPGYWDWSEDLEDFVWIDGTYVVRPPKPVKVAATPPAAPPPPPPADEPPAVRELDARVAPPPAVRVETIAPPPPTPGALWVAGHWQLAGSAWRWIPGGWILPPSGTTRYRPPAVQLRGAVRIYIPGRWIGGR